MARSRQAPTDPTQIAEARVVLADLTGRPLETWAGSWYGAGLEESARRIAPRFDGTAATRQRVGRELEVEALASIRAFAAVVRDLAGESSTRDAA